MNMYGIYIEELRPEGGYVFLTHRFLNEIPTILQMMIWCISWHEKIVVWEKFVTRDQFFITSASVQVML